MKSQRSGVESARHDPELFRSVGGGVDALAVAAGERVILRIANQKNRECSAGDGFFRRHFVRRETSQRFSTVNQRPGSWSEKRFAEPGITPESRIVIGSFAEIREGSFGDDGFDAGIEASGLKSDACAHGFAEGKEMRVIRV